jgi:hypothetical protein
VPWVASKGPIRCCDGLVGAAETTLPRPPRPSSHAGVCHLVIRVGAPPRRRLAEAPLRAHGLAAFGFGIGAAKNARAIELTHCGRSIGAKCVDSGNTAS